MGRKSKQELQEKQLLNESEIKEYLPESFKEFHNIENYEFAFNLYQFTRLIYDNIK